MKNMLKYRGYYGTVKYSDGDECFFGKVFGINDLILFEGDSVRVLKTDFYEAVDSYLESYEERGRESNRFRKDSFNIRVALGLHKKAALAAGRRHQMLNSFMKSAVCTMVSTIL